ncbi:hypothetical protein ECML606-1_000080 [Escherichia phage ECML-606-1]|nr:hypothetical protein ECML606-1_000080 [Escherichia phage ECML-606-1]
MAKSAPSKHHLAACVKQAKAEGYADLIVATKGRRVILSGMVNGALCHAATVSEHRTAEKALEQSIMCKRWLRDMLPGERAPQLAGQVIIPVDTGLATSKTIIPRINKQGDNNADAFLHAALHFGIMRHGVSGLRAMLDEMATDARYASYQNAGLRQ